LSFVRAKRSFLNESTKIFNVISTVISLFRFTQPLNSGFPYYRLSQLIEYKAKWLGIKVIKVSERNTSKTCHRCGNIGLRVGGLFKCPNCGYSCNADYNGAMNILKRATGYTPVAGAAFDTALELGRMKPLGKQTENLPT